MNRTFRVHHILCTALYTGLGYSGDFCENMTAITSFPAPVNSCTVSI